MEILDLKSKLNKMKNSLAGLKNGLEIAEK